MIALALIIGMALLLPLGWKAQQLYRAPHNAPLRAVTLCLAAVTASFGLALPPSARVIREIAGPGGPRLVQNTFAFVMVFWLMCFYLYSTAEPRRGRIRARWEALPLGITVLGCTLATAAARGQDSGDTFNAIDMRVSAFAIFYLLADLYLVYALTMALRWTWRLAGRSQAPLTTGLRLIGYALVGIASASALRAVLTVLRWRGAPVSSIISRISGHVIAVSLFLFLIGVLYPAVRTRLSVIRLRGHRRAMYRRMQPLWNLLHEAFPQDALHESHHAPWSLSRLRLGVDRRYYRRAIECRDGLVRISPYLWPAAAPEPSEHAGSDGRSGLSKASADDLADQLYRALHAQAEGRTVPSGAVAVAVPQAQTLDEDVRQLVLLSDALRRRAAHRTAPPASSDHQESETA
ncbi:MAB_1171c family putative transporter [Streptomyces sp. NPDC051576]|uniref:MAB_1171c family putative transporter n=1 Tax=Streptomyces sp. NPDC051576 TaxID=3155803 RepID=UPI00341E523F